MNEVGRDEVPRATCSFSRSAAARIASNGGRGYVYLRVTADTTESEEMRKDDTPRPRLSLYASVTEPSAEPSKAIEFVRYELDGLEGWPETQSRPEVFVDDWLRPPSRINLTRFVDGFNVSLGKKVEPRLTDAAHRTWLEQYWRDSDKSRVNKGPATALFGLGAWILAAGVYLFWTTAPDPGSALTV
jgi:hypothetical protein